MDHSLANLLMIEYINSFTFYQKILSKDNCPFMSLGFLFHWLFLITLSNAKPTRRKSVVPLPNLKSYYFRGKDFRVDYGNLAVSCATFSSAPAVAMTATASKDDRESIKKSLGLKTCAEVIGNPDRTNIMYEKHFRGEPDVDSLVRILSPIAEDLLKERINYPLTIIYIPLKWCGFAYKIFESVLGNSQYFPTGSMPVPENRLFAQFHSPQTQEMKDVILKQLCSSESTVRVVFATVALGMGVDIKGIRSVVHITPPPLYHPGILSRNWQSWKGWTTSNCNFALQQSRYCKKQNRNA